MFRFYHHYLYPYLVVVLRLVYGRRAVLFRRVGHGAGVEDAAGVGPGGAGTGGVVSGGVGTGGGRVGGGRGPRRAGEKTTRLGEFTEIKDQSLRVP